MGLFDFLKPKKAPLDELMEKDPGVRRAFLYGGSEMVSAQANNLRAVGRKDDADKLIAEYVQKVFQEFKNEPEDPRHLHLLTAVALRLGALAAGKRTLESVIEGNDHLSLDLTMVYTDLGRIYHQLRTDLKRELWCYEMATEAKPPLACKFPATRQQKARAHHFAHFVALRLAKYDPADSHWNVAESHAKRARELVPEVDWDDEPQVRKFWEASNVA